ncbi:MAG: hypothetical protein M1823_006051 [Watsoniomyces obsoletus]|nr:MAG: hypothetical protein M1823_006051 [Watsoniomyces obsoletus]
MISAVLLGGALPMIFVAYTTSPFVVYVHLRLPFYARRSHDILTRFSRTLAPTTELDITTMRFTGWSGITRVQLGELRPARKRLGVANLTRVLPLNNPPPVGTLSSSAKSATPNPATKNPWWRKQRNDFYVGNPKLGKSKMIRASAIWENILAAIHKNGQWKK